MFNEPVADALYGSISEIGKIGLYSDTNVNNKDKKFI
jgi:hypothetical protein